MVSKAKLYSQLDRMEEELHERLVPHLKLAAQGLNAHVFCTTDFNPFPERKLTPDAETDTLIQLGRQILVLRGKLGESSDGTLAEQICVYCRKWGDADGSRKSAEVLAAEFLKGLSESG